MAFTFPTIGFTEFHEGLRRSATVGRQHADGLRPITFALPDGRAVTYRVVDDRITWDLIASDDAVTVVAIDETSFGAFALEFLTAPALQIQQRITFERGNFSELDRWEPLLRRLSTDRPLFDPDAVDRSELDREFVWGRDPIEEIVGFHRRNGFAVVRRVFSTDEMHDLDAEIDRLATNADPDDGESWWVRSEDGSDHVCQIHYASLGSLAIDGLATDSRIREVVDALDSGFVAHPTIGNGHFAVIKNPGTTGGLTDLAWHVDCGLGGHPLTCPSLHIGIQIRPMTAASGPMMFLAGSHLTSPVRPTPADESTWPIVTVVAEPGDITLHSPDTVHCAPPPTGVGDGRRTIYLSFGRPELSEVFGHKEGYDHLIFPKEGHVAFGDD